MLYLLLYITINYNITMLQISDAHSPYRNLIFLKMGYTFFSCCPHCLCSMQEMFCFFPLKALGQSELCLQMPLPSLWKISKGGALF